MMEHFAASPFGGARIRLSEIQDRHQINERRKALVGDEGASSCKVEKWRLTRALAEARHHFDLSDRAITVLEGLLSFHQSKELDGRRPIVVFPSNAELSLRCRGMAQATLRRHLASLCKAGLIFRRDSPNGKRYCRRTADGAVEDAFGFDVSPLALKADAIFSAAEKARSESRRLQKLRCDISIHQRDISKMLDASVEVGSQDRWNELRNRFGELVGRPSRSSAHEVLEAFRSRLEALDAEVKAYYLEAIALMEMSANECENERHIQSPELESLIVRTAETSVDSDFDDCLGASSAVSMHTTEKGQAAPQPSKHEPIQSLVTVERLQRLCPQLADYALHGLRSWRDVVNASEVIGRMLGISADALCCARAAMGSEITAVSVAIILEKIHQIRSPGGYLRDLTRKAERGAFSLKSMLAALGEARLTGCASSA